MLRDNLKPEIEILEEFEEKHDLNDAEIFWISYFKMIGCNLTNISKGGDGNVCLKGAEHPMFGKHHSDETRKILSTKATGKKLSDCAKKKISMKVKGEYNGRFGKKNSEYANLINALKHSKAIVCLNDEKVFQSGKLAAKFYNINPTSICHILKGRCKSTRTGLKFAFVENNGVF